jgi:lipoic acid synthetase
VNRDDVPEGGAYIFAGCITKIREHRPHCRIELLIPDFGGSTSALRKVIDARPDVLNHNIESSRRIFPRVRPKGDYRLSLDLLAESKEMDPGMVTKSGIIAGMGETRDEIV